ncbi:MAG: leucine--tRNA ligase, partial [Nanoarchaeota archaeon]
MGEDKENLRILKDAGEKWQIKWEENGVFEPEINNEKKFFLTYPYPYINAHPHIGHLYTIMRVDAFARYKRSRGYNVLFPQGWHATGSPIISAANRIREREEKQINMMKKMGIPDSEIPKFETPEYWIEYFAPIAKQDYSLLGLSIDWRREFYTTSINPHYDKFIRWQFRKLREQNYVIKGKFPVVWDPKTNVPVGDHDRTEGEGEVPQEYVLLKFDLGGEFLIAATLRPETMYGQTNLWINPEIEYVKASVNEETWIISYECAEKLKQQDYQLSIINKIKGEKLIGKMVTAPVVERDIPVLPATFPTAEKGTGIVTSVPSDAPDDYMGLVELQNNPLELEKYGVDKSTAEIEPIPIIRSSKLGDIAAKKAISDYGIKSINEREKLEKAKKEVYKKGFYEGEMLVGDYEGEKVEIAKEKIKKDFVNKGIAHLFYELTGKVVSRNLSECIVRIVSDQWFLNYADPEWKKLAHKCLERINLYPEKARQQFKYVIDWLHEWACTREEGLGTRLPWDEKWLIESLSDSTIYMAYYTIAHRITEADSEKLDDNFFDYVFLGKERELLVDKNWANELKKEFDYWYPVDFRNSGKDLIQNHLTFFIFNHTAIFPEDKWPRGIGVNGWVTVDGEKMSKSKGNVVTIRKMVQDYGPDIPRITILSGGEELDDPNWDSSFANSMVSKLPQWFEVLSSNYGLGRENWYEIDNWMQARLHESIKKATKAMDDTLFRTAYQTIFFELGKHIKWYLRRCKNQPNTELFKKVVKSQLLMMQPFSPHICEETWNKIGMESFISKQFWPGFDETKITEDTETLVINTMNDIKTVARLAKLEKPGHVKLFLAPAWKYELFNLLTKELKQTSNQKDIIDNMMKTEMREYGKDAVQIIQKIVKNGHVPPHFSMEKETKIFEDARDFLESELDCQVDIIKAIDATHKKSTQALP